MIGERLLAGARHLQRISMNKSGDELLAWSQRHLPHHVPLNPSRFHRWLSSELAAAGERRGLRLAAVAPRGHAKSEWSSILYPLYCVLEGAEPFILIVSETREQAEGFLEAIKHELLENRSLAEAYPDAVGKGPVWSQKTIVTRSGCRIYALGCGGRIRGRRSLERRPSLIIVDDADGDEAAYSERRRDKAWAWYSKAVEKAGDPDTNIVVIGTLIHEDVIVGRMLKQPGVRSRKFPAVLEWPERMDLWDKWEALLLHTDERAASAFLDEHRTEMLAGAEVLWPELEDFEKLMRTRATGGRASFMSEKQNTPVPPGSVRFDFAWWEGEDLWFDEPPAKSIAFCAVDPCVGKRGTEGDLAAIVWGWWKQGDRHLYVDADLARRPSTATNERVIDLHSAYKFLTCAYEANGFQGEVGEDLLRRAAEQGLPLPVMPIVHTVPKLMRIEALGPLFATRNIKFRRGSPGASMLVKHLKYFAHPKIEPYDGPDALEMLIATVFGFISRSMPGGDTLSVSGSVVRG